MKRDEAVRIDVLADRRNRAEALERRLDDEMGGARQPRADLARLRGLLARGDPGEDVARGLLSPRRPRARSARR